LRVFLVLQQDAWSTVRLQEASLVVHT
jgi:hypothetical protein